MRRTSGERGQVWAVFLICLAAIGLMAAVIADLAPAFTDKIGQRTALDRVEAELSLPSSALIDSQGDVSDDSLPGGADTGLKVARRAVSAARAAGFSGTVEVWFYEGAEETGGSGRVDANDRLWAWCVRLTEDAQTMFSGVTGADGIRVSTEAAGTANPYARARVYRSPTSAASPPRKFTSSSGADVDSPYGTAFSLAEAPEALRSAYEDGYASLRDD